MISIDRSSSIILYSFLCSLALIMTENECCQSRTTAKVLSGTAISKDILAALKQEVDKMQEMHRGFRPGLSIVQVGDRADSNVYIKMKMKAAAEIGIKSQHHHLPRTTTQDEILSLLKKLNEDSSVHGIIVQMPLDCDTEIDSSLVTDSVLPDKDVDGLHAMNQGKVAIGDTTSGLIPCTPNAVLELISRCEMNITGKRVVVMGRSKIIGTPVSELLKWQDATVTTCHKETRNIEKLVAEADILVVAIGKAQYVRGSWIKPGAVVIDCGINVIEDLSRKSGTRLVGDVNYEEASKVAAYLTPVPGGVGPMTVAMLMKNTVLSARRGLEVSARKIANGALPG